MPAPPKNSKCGATGCISIISALIRTSVRALSRVPGFVNRVDIRGLYNTVYYRFRPKKGWILNWGPSMLQRYVFDHEGNRLDTNYDPYLKIEGRGQTIYLAGSL